MERRDGRTGQGGTAVIEIIGIDSRAADAGLRLVTGKTAGAAT